MKQVTLVGKRGTKEWLLVLVAFFLLFSLRGQELELSPRIEFFSIPNSAINSEEISDIKVDKDGYVWVVSFKSLYRYDGERFQKISANYNSFASLIRFYEGDRGEKFVIDYWGAIYFVKNDSMFEYSQNSKIREHYKSYGYSDVSFEDSSLHFSYHASGYKISKKDSIFDPLVLNRSEFNGHAARLREGKLPFMFTGNRSSSTSNDTLNFYLFNSAYQKIDSCKQPHREYYNPSAIVQLRNGNYLYSSGKGNLIEFNEQKIIKSTFYPAQIIHLFTDKAGNLWVSTRGEGVHFYEAGVINYEVRQVVLPHTTTIVTTQDYQNGIWLYSQSKGIGYISHPSIKFLTQQESVKPLVETLIAVKDKVVYSDGNFLKSIKDKKIEDVVHIKEQVMRLSYDKERDRIWVSTRGNLLYWEGETLKSVPNFKNRFSGSFSYLSSDWNDSTFSLVASNGYQYFGIKDNEVSFESKKYDQKLKGVLLLKDTFYVNTGNGIYIETPDTAYYLGNRFSIAKSSCSQLLLFGEQRIFSFPSDGLHEYKEGKFIPIRYNGEVIPDARLIEENKNAFWAISNYGCFKISRKNDGSKELSVEAFSSLPRMVLKSAAIYDNKLYLQTRNSGLGIIQLSSILGSTLYPPELLITKVQTKNKAYFDEFNIKPIEYAENEIQVSFKSLNYHDLDILYRYRLKGSYNEWAETTTGFVNFVSLEPGAYEFEVQSRFGLGSWSPSRKIQFSIVPPIWQRWWFALISILVLLFIVYKIMSYRFAISNREKSLVIQRLTAEQKALQTKMDPHFMFNVISSIQYLILRKENEKATTFLNRFSTLLRSTLNQSDNEYIKIKDELRFLKEYIELEKMRLEDKFDYSIELEVNQEYKIPTFILQPFVENSIQHGLKAKHEQGFLKIHLSKEGDFLKVEITDDGIGYNASIRNKVNVRKHISHGIATIEERLKIYNGKNIKEHITIEDLKDFDGTKQGTRVIVFLKIIEE